VPAGSAAGCLRTCQNLPKPAKWAWAGRETEGGEEGAVKAGSARRGGGVLTGVSGVMGDEESLRV
jgi:hypothetical protein